MYFTRISWGVSEALWSDENLLARKDDMLYAPCMRMCKSQPWSTISVMPGLN